MMRKRLDLCLHLTNDNSKHDFYENSFTSKNVEASINSTQSSQLQDVLTQKAVTKEALKSYQEKLVKANQTIDELKCKISHLSSTVKVEEDYTESLNGNVEKLRAQFSASKKSIETQVMNLNKEVESHKDRAFASELQILDLRIVISRHKLLAKIAKAEYYWQRILRINNQFSQNLSADLHQYCRELCDYTDQLHNQLSSLEETYLRLRYNLLEGLSVDVREIDVYPPLVPQFF